MHRLRPHLVLFAMMAPPLSATSVPRPVTPDAMPEAVALLEFLHAISGRHTLTGQHNYPATGARNSDFATNFTGRVPAVWTSDFGFAAEGDTDSYLARPAIVAEAIRQHRMGAIVSLCWHAVPPTADEPVTFRPLPGADPNRLASVQGQLTDTQFRDVLTPGTPLHAQWVKQVDAIAGFLRQLQEAHVPVLWRPYHEMNGDWFWWGGRHEGDHTTAALYRQIFDRLVHHHQLKNLVWEWSVDRVSGRPERAYEKYFPGRAYLDVVCLDVYGRDFAQTYYDELVTLAAGKPLALAEVGNPPSPEILARQPLWTYYATWAGMVRNTPKEEYLALFQDPRVLSLSDPGYAKVIAPLRAACGLPPVEVSPPPPRFAGTWILNVGASTLETFGAGSVPAKLEVTQDGDALTIAATRIIEWAGPEVSQLSLVLGGPDAAWTNEPRPRTSTARRSDDGAGLVLTHASDAPSGPSGTKFLVRETWTLTQLGDRLSIHHVTPSPEGAEAGAQTFIYDRR